MLFLKEFFIKLIMTKNQQTSKGIQNYPVCRIKYIFFLQMLITGMGLSVKDRDVSLSSVLLW